jgi:phosphoglycolate phosphatase-like HAD superfamily hydrolase
LKVEGVVFDLDATLVNLGGFVDWRAAQRQVTEAYLACGCSEEAVKRCGERNLFDMLNIMEEQLQTMHPQDEAKRIQGRAYAVIDICEAQGVDQCQLMPGCVEALKWLRERGVKMGVATSNSQEVTERILELRELRSFFSAIVGRTPELRMKPYPDQILACFRMIGVDPRRGVVVGDSVRDVKAAKAAEIYVVAVPAHFTRRETLEQAGADSIISSLGELPAVLSSLLP